MRGAEDFPISHGSYQGFLQAPHLPKKTTALANDLQPGPKDKMAQASLGSWSCSAVSVHCEGKAIDTAACKQVPWADWTLGLHFV